MIFEILKITKAILDPSSRYEVCNSLCSEVFEKEEDSEQFAEAIINFFEANGKLLSLLQHLVSSEIENTSMIYKFSFFSCFLQIDFELI